jgi:GntR family transcriptional regulator
MIRNTSSGETGALPDELKPEPLYARVRDRLRQRIAAGAWLPGAMIPSEHEIAAELGVSQGTVRKALDELTEERLLVRRQGRGTFVAEHDASRALFQFFKIEGDDGMRRLPDSRVVSVTTGAPDAGDAERLGLAPRARVIRIERIRLLDDKPVIFERIAVPLALFRDLATARDLPNHLYGLYAAEFGVIVARAVERLKAVAASRAAAKWLGVPPGAPLLQIDRDAIDLTGRVVERRVSICLTERHTYVSDLR